MELQPGEEVIYEGHPSWRSIVDFYLAGLLVVAAAAAIGYLIQGVAVGGAALVVALLLVLLVGWLRRASTRYLITTKRLQVRRGLLSRRTEETRVDRVVDVTVRQSILQRLMRIGTVDFDNASAQQGDLFRFSGVADPSGVVRAIDQVHERAQAPPASAGT